MNDMELEKEIISYRRDFHKYAETAWTEFRTSSKIAEILSSLGYDVLVGREMIETDAVMGRDDDIQKYIDRALSQGANKDWIDRMDGYTGVLAVLDTKRSGPTIAFRFDIDANDVSEVKEDTHRPNKDGFSSINEGAMHACGHDGHGAIGLGLAHELITIKEKLRGRIKLIFQPAEEGVRGAKAIVSKGILDDVDYFFSGHIGFNTSTGKIMAGTKGFLCTTKLDVEYIGKGSHAGAAPNEGRNALLAAASATLNLHGIAPHKEGPTRINVGVLEGGIGRNVIPPRAHMKIETRGLTEEINRYVYERAVKIIEHTAAMYDVAYSIKKMGEAVDCTCDEDLMDLVIEVAKENKAIKEIIREGYLGGSEDVSLMIKRVQQKGGKATYMIFGTKTTAGQHNEWFDFDESVLLIAVKLYKDFVIKLAL